MKPNKVSQWIGELVWVGEPRTGKTKNGKDWSSVDFVLKYTDEQGNERNIMFNTFGNEKVNTMVACDKGATIHVDWRPDAREYNGKWFGKLDAYGIEITERPSTKLPENSPAFGAEADDDDLPI